MGTGCQLYDGVSKSLHLLSYHIVVKSSKIHWAETPQIKMGVKPLTQVGMSRWPTGKRGGLV